MNLRRFFALALTIGACQCASTAETSSRSSATTTSTSPGVAPTSLKVDIIFPQDGARYSNATKSLPIVIAAQNLKAAAGITGNFTSYQLTWVLGSTTLPGYVASGKQEFLSDGDVPEDPYVFVSNTNLADWDPKGLPYLANGTLFGIWYTIDWLNGTGWQCSRQTRGRIIEFYLQEGMPEPDLLELPPCPKESIYLDLDAEIDVLGDTCPTIQSNEDGDICALNYDNAMATSVSSVWAAMAAATTASTSTTDNAAVARYTSPPVLAAAAMLGALELAFL